MPVIIITSDSNRTGREIAESAAAALGYRFVGREILGKAAEKYGIPEARLLEALDKSPSLLRRSSKLRKRCMAYIQEVILSELRKDNVVCQGLAAHLYVLGVSHVLRVRILSDTEELTGPSAAQRRISLDTVKKLLDREKAAQRRWSMDAFSVDETDPSHYDLVISLAQIDSKEAVKIIRETVGYPRFKPMTYSVNCMEDLALSSRVRALVWETFPGAGVRADRGVVIIETIGLKRDKEKKVKAIKELAREIPGVEYVEVHVTNHLFRQAGGTLR